MTTASTLKSHLKEWCDWDGAAFHLAVSIGLMQEQQSFGKVKHLFWSTDGIACMLYGMLDQLVERGVLEKREEPDIQYRWNKQFRGSWELR